jgi:hypothetical protein
MKRRDLLRKLAVAPLIALGSSSGAGVSKSPLKIMMKSAWGSDDPTKAAFPFLHGHALAEAGHEVQIFLLEEAVSLMRKSVASSVVPGLAAPGGGPGQGCRAEDSHLRLWRLFSGERSNGS